MIQQVTYNSEDIAKFLEVHESTPEYEYSQTLQKLLSVQNRISIIADIEQTELKIIIDKLKFVKHNFKDYVIKEGEISKEIFFTLSGEFHVFNGGNKIGVIPAGNAFGETAAIFNTKRNASVVCASKEATLLSFCINADAIEFCPTGLATLYKNLASQINSKLEEMNHNLAKK